MAGLTADSLLEPLSLRRKLYVNVGVDGMSSVLKLVYGAPHLVLHPVMLLVSLYAVEYYLSVGATYGYLVLGVALGRAVDIVLTPFMASTTDAFRSVYGRRKPFIFMAVLFYCLMLLLLFTPPSSFSGAQKAVWFCLSHIGFVVGHVFLAVPYDALGMELASSYDDRSSLWWLCALFQYVGNFALLLVCLALPLVKYNSPGNASSSLGSRSQSCSADSCYSPTGVGTSCRAYYPLPWRSGASSYRDDGQAPQLEFQQFVIFNATQWAAQPSSATALAAAFASSASAAAAKYGQCRVGIGSNGQVYSTPSELFQPAACLEGGALRSSGCISAYCQCLSSCQALCAQDSRSSGTVLGTVLVASGLLLLSVFIALGWLQERALLKAPLSLLPAPGTAGALLSVLHNNPALRSLLLPWFLDSLVQALTLGLLGYYVRLLVKPSEQRKALHGVECNGGLGSGVGLPAGGNLFESEALCKGDTATGALLASYFLAAVAGCCLWRLAASRWGKKIAWVATSLASFAALLCWVGVGVSALPSSANSPSLPAALGVVLVMGAASGGQWITDSMVADAVEYHEFLTGQRLEAACSLWRSLLPKLASVCAVAFPVASLWSLGMLPPVAGLDQLSSPSQPDTVRIYIVAVGAALPAALALVSAWIKCSYPLRSRQGVRLVSEGVGLHLQHAAAMDPLTGLDYEREHWETLGGLFSVDAGDGEKGRESRSQGQGQGQGQPADQRNAWLQRVLLMDCFPSLEGA